MAAVAIAVGDLLQCRVITHDPATEQLGLNVWWAKVASLVGAGLTQNDAAESLETLLAPLYKNALCNDVNWWGAGIRNYSIIPLPDESISHALAGAGAIDGPTAPDQLCGFASFYTGNAGPGGRGRKYYPFVPLQGVGVDNKIIDAQLALYDIITQVLVNAMTLLNPLGTSGIVMQSGVYSVITDEHPVRVFTPFTEATTFPYLATQRRRGAYGRPNPPPT
jgi:hypothetical protein